MLGSKKFGNQRVSLRDSRTFSSKIEADISHKIVRLKKKGERVVTEHFINKLFFRIFNAGESITIQRL